MISTTMAHKRTEPHRNIPMNLMQNENNTQLFPESNTAGEETGASKFTT